MMKRLLLAAAAALVAAPAFAADVGVSISVGEPGFYGQINIGGYPAPQLVYPQPMVVERGRAVGGPIYLHVPPGHAKHWRRYCHQYNACGRPVYFVRDGWYNDVYVPRHREHMRRRHEERRDHYQDRGDRYRDREQRRDFRGPPGQGHGNGRGRGDD